MFLQTFWLFPCLCENIWYLLSQMLYMFMLYHCVRLETAALLPPLSPSGPVSPRPTAKLTEIFLCLCRRSIHLLSLFLEAAGQKWWPWTILSFLGKHTLTLISELCKVDLCWPLTSDCLSVAASCSFIGRSKFPERAKSLRRSTWWQRSLSKVRLKHTGCYWCSCSTEINKSHIKHILIKLFAVNPTVNIVEKLLIDYHYQKHHYYNYYCLSFTQMCLFKTKYFCLWIKS